MHLSWQALSASCKLVNDPSDIGDISDFLRKSMRLSRRICFIILYGLDECPESDITEVLLFLHGLLNFSDIHVKVFCSTRPNVLENLPPRHRPYRLLSLEDPTNRDKVANDISEYIRVSVQAALGGNEPQWQLTDPLIAFTVMKRLKDDAGGM